MGARWFPATSLRPEVRPTENSNIAKRGNPNYLSYLPVKIHRLVFFKESVIFVRLEPPMFNGLREFATGCALLVLSATGSGQTYQAI